MVSYIPDLTAVVGNGLGAMTGGDPTLAGIFALGIMLLLWAYLGAGMEVGAIVFAPVIILFWVSGYLPYWTAIIAALAIAVGAAKMWKGGLA